MYGNAAFSRVTLGAFDTHLGATLVLLTYPAAGAAAADDCAVPDDRHAALAEEDVVTLDRDDPAECRIIRPLGQVAAGLAKGGRGYCLALVTLGVCPDCAVHTLEGHQPIATVAACRS